MANYDSNYAIAQEISARIGTSPIPFDSVYSIALEIYNELGGEPAEFDSVYSILLGILPLVEGGGSNVINDNIIVLDKTWSSSKINDEIQAVAGTANSDIEGKSTEDFHFVTELPQEAEEDEQVVIKGENADTLYKYVSGAWVEETPDANKLYFDTENEALYSYVTVDGQFAPVSMVNTIVVGSNLNSNTALKAIKTPGVYSVVQRLHSSTKGDYIKNWTLTVEGVDYDEYERTDSVYQRIQSNYTIQKRTWSSTRATNDGWSSFSTYYAGEIKDTTTSKYYTWSSNKLTTELGAKQDALTAGQNISIDSANTISADGYVYNASDGSFATKYLNTDEDESYIATNTASGEGAFAEGYGTTATGMGNHAEGGATQATGTQCAHAEGLMTVASGKNSHAEGSKSVASGQNSHAEGNKSVASGNHSHAEGGALKNQNPTTASGNGSHAEGQSTLASAQSSHAEGELTVASGAGSHAEGNMTVASGIASHAEGDKIDVLSPTTAAGRSSHAEGTSTLAQNESEHAEGRVNVSHKASDTYGNAGNTQHSVGIFQKNALEVMQNGDYYLYGVGGYQGTNTKVQDSTIRPLQTVISDINTSVAGKQDTLTAGTNITISGTTISATYETATTADVDAIFNNPRPKEIWYTSTDSNIVTPHSTSALPTIVSNTYGDGKGKIKFASELTSIGYQAFYLKSGLASVTIPNNVTSIGKGAFWGCSRLTSINIPDNVTSIGDNAFDNTRLTSINIPNSVTSIGMGAFYGCGSLTNISFNGTVAEWNAITKGTNWHTSVPATVVHCTDGDVNI